MIIDLIVRFARENPTWGYDGIQGALANVGYHISDTTVANVLKQHGIEPASDRKRQTTWATFLKAHSTEHSFFQDEIDVTAQPIT